MGNSLSLKSRNTPPKVRRSPPWRVLIVDDEPDVHTVTELALKRFEFDERDLEFLHAYSGIEAKEILVKENDIAIILLDVVMESDQAGLELVSYIRQTIMNSAARIILRTGQPGQAPEQTVIREYDINDYRNKAELTANKLSTLIYASLRSYRDICTLQRSKSGLEKLILASRGISSRQALVSFVEVTMRQMITLLNLDETALFSCETRAFKLQDTVLEMFAAEDDSLTTAQVQFTDLTEDKRDILEEAIAKKGNVYKDNRLVMYCANKSLILLFYVKVDVVLSDLDVHLFNIFTENLIVILENIRLNELINESQREMIYRLGEVVESRSNETGNHVKRVSLYSELLAQLVGLTEDECTLIKYASPLHDIGKISIPDAILNKPGPLTPEEWVTMKTHAQKGFDILNGSGLMLMDIGAKIAQTHHEKWDGSGYPEGDSKNNIHIYGRITALADVFDALASARCYKKAWPLEEVLDYIEDQSGIHFDPNLVRLLMDNLKLFLEIKRRFSDSYLIEK